MSAELSMRCPVCEVNVFDAGPEIFDDRYGEPNRYQLARCTGCGHMATAPRLRGGQGKASLRAICALVERYRQPGARW